MDPDDRAPTGNQYLTDEERKSLVVVADTTIYNALTAGSAMLPNPREFEGRLALPGASFVTLRRNGALLGCIGSMEPRRALVVDVAENAYGAAFRDPRLPAVTLEDYAEMDIKISVLTPLHRLAVSSMADLLAAIRPGTDGLLIASPGHRGTFLPSVWEQLPRPDEFLAHLWLKAGLQPGTWPRDLTVDRYETVEFGPD